MKPAEVKNVDTSFHSPAVQARLLGQLAVRGLERRLPVVDEPGRQLEQARIDRDAPLAHEREPVVTVDRDDRSDRSMNDDIAALAPFDTEDRSLVQRHRQDPDECPAS